MYKAYKIRTLEDSLWISPQLDRDLPSIHAHTPQLAARQYPSHNRCTDKTGYIALFTLTEFVQPYPSQFTLTYPNIGLPNSNTD